MGFFCLWTHGEDLLQSNIGKTLYLNFNPKVRKLLTYVEQMDWQYGSPIGDLTKDYALLCLKCLSSYPERQELDYRQGAKYLLIIEKEIWTIP
jgi:hypothetical protein